MGAMIHNSTRFEFLFRVERGGHRFFKEKDGDRIAIADESGDTRIAWGTPEMTEDGVLWLDTTRPIEVERYGEDQRECVSLPLIQERNGSPTSTPISFISALYLAERFGMQITTPMNAYKVERQMKGEGE